MIKDFLPTIKTATDYLLRFYFELFLHLLTTIITFFLRVIEFIILALSLLRDFDM